MFRDDATGAGRFDRVACDLSDVLGAPGTGSPEEAADRMTGELGAAMEALPVAPGFHLRSAGGVGAFAPPTAGLARTSAAVDVLLSADDGATRVVTEITSPSGTHQVRVQTVNGRRVIGGGYRLHASPTGEIAVTGSPVGDLGSRYPGPVPRRRRLAVADAMRAQLDLPAELDLAIETVLFPLEGGAVWAYAGSGVHWTEEEIADLRVVVRASDLSLLVSRDAAQAATWGEAEVYASNPGRDPVPRRVRLSDLGGDGSLLRSRWFDVAARIGQRPVRPLRDWRLAPDATGFDEVSCYHHLTRAATWYASIIGPDVLSGPPFTPLKIVTGDRASRDWVGRFLPSTQTIAFGDGDLPGSRAADVCLHELTHAVVWAARRIDDIGPIEARGLNEGYADYAQASLLDDPRFGDWVRPAQVRDCSSPTVRFPADPAAATSPYGIGSAWAAVLWELRQVVGAGVADALAFDTIFYLDETSAIGAARTALLASDAQLFPAGDGHGRHADAIAAAFDRRTAP